MKLSDWALFLVIGIGAYSLGFFASRSEYFKRMLAVSPVAELHLLVDSSVDFSQGLNLSQQFPHIRIKAFEVKTRDGFKESLPIADMALARMNWLMEADRKALPILQLIQKIDRNIHPFFRRAKYHEAQIIPLLWSLPQLVGPLDQSPSQMTTLGFTSDWPFLPFSDFFTLKASLTQTSPFKVGVWNRIVQDLSSSSKLTSHSMERKGLVLGLMIFDTPKTRSLPLDLWLYELLESPTALRAFVATGLGLTWMPVGRDHSDLVPEPQRAERAILFNLRSLQE